MRGHPYSLPGGYFGRIACRSSGHRPHEDVSSQLHLVPNIDWEIEQRVGNCSSCQRVRKPPAAAPLAPWMLPSNPWHRIHIDFAEDEKRHYFILVDAHSRWLQIFYMPRSTSAASRITILRELFAKYGMLVQCVSDHGPQFRSEEFPR